MTPEQKRIAIAEFCGWKHITSREIDFWTQVGKSAFESPPDYLNDLNAMNEAEQCLVEPSRQDAYCLALAQICNAVKDWNLERMNVVAWKTMRATAAQRADALLKVIGGI